MRRSNKFLRPCTHQALGTKKDTNMVIDRNILMQEKVYGRSNDQVKVMWYLLEFLIKKG